MYRSDQLLAAVRSLPCQVPGCGAPAPSEPMHGNLLSHGKGKQMKAPDSRIAAGCRACHREIDQGRLPFEQRLLLWSQASAATYATLMARGVLRVSDGTL